MRILIAGATGLIGGELVSQCQQLGIGVNYLTTRVSKIKGSENFQGFYWNPKKGEIDTRALVGVNAIINLAGAAISERWTTRRKKNILSSRIDTANVLLETLRNTEHSVEHYISASGIGIYPSSYDHLYHESYEGTADTFLGTVVKEWEASADSFESLNIKVTKVRTGMVLSDKEGALPKLMKPIKMGVGAPLGTGEQWQSWIHIKDVVGIYLHILNEGLTGVFNAVSPNPVTNKRLIQTLAHFTDSSIWLPNVPSFVLRLVLGQMASVVLESQLVSAEKIIGTGYTFRFVNLENALENLI